MKQWLAFALPAAALAAVLAAAGLGIAANMDDALARYPGAQFLGDEHFDELTIHAGYLGVGSTYRTSAQREQVWRWYGRHFALEQLDQGVVNPRLPCVTLASSRQRLFVQRAITVTLCPGEHGTLIYVRQSVVFGR